MRAARKSRSVGASISHAFGPGPPAGLKAKDLRARTGAPPPDAQTTLASIFATTRCRPGRPWTPASSRGPGSGSRRPDLGDFVRSDQFHHAREVEAAPAGGAVHRVEVAGEFTQGDGGADAHGGFHRQAEVLEHQVVSEAAGVAARSEERR